MKLYDEKVIALGMRNWYQSLIKVPHPLLHQFGISFLAVRPWANPFTSPDLICFTCKVGILVSETNNFLMCFLSRLYTHISTQ